MDDKYAAPHTRESFQAIIQAMQNPKQEDYMVISGKHTFNTQRSAVLKNCTNSDWLQLPVPLPMVKPGLVNLVPGSIRNGRVDPTRRNILIR